MHEHQWLAVRIAPLETMNRQTERVDGAMARLGHGAGGLDALDRHFDEVGFLTRPREGFDRFHVAVVDRGDNLRRFGISRFSKRSSSITILGRKVGS